MPTIWGFDNVENKRGRDFMKMSFISLREHTTNILDFEKKNVTVNKTRIRRKSILYLEKKIPKVY